MTTRVTITVDDAHRRSIGALAGTLAAAGLRIEKILTAVGCIVGSIAAPDLEPALRRVPGVASIDTEVIHRISPPTSMVQ